MKFSQASSLIALSTLSSAAPFHQRRGDSSLCKNISLPIYAEAENAILPPFPDSTAAGAMYTYLGSFNSSAVQSAPIKGTYNIAATYCEPTFKVKGRDAIQLLVHGLTATKEYWNGYDGAAATFDGEYSWVAHAQDQGYSTLAIDRLGNGESDHPDPLQVVQGSLQVAQLQKIVAMLRNGTLPSVPKYNKIIMATHSYGAVLGRLVATFYPTSGADAYILTAAATVLTGLEGLLVGTQARAASVVLGGEYASYAPGYVAAASSSIHDILYPPAGQYDPKMLAVDMAQPHIYAVGEIATSSPAIPTNFTGPVMVITGTEDQIACGNGNITSLVPNCGVGPGSSAANMSTLFPKSCNFGSFSPANSAHVVNSQYSASESFGAAMKWLADVGF